jgi:ABC-type uncharacterized transport system involved in gliding motility auxiliary subunit
MSARQFAWLASLFLVIAFAGLTGAAQTFLAPLRADLTQERLSTISPATKAVLARLTEPVTIEYFRAQEALAADPLARAHARRVDDLLRALAGASGGQVRVVHRDPAPFTATEDAALEAGLVPLVYQDAGAAAASGGVAPLYLGLVLRNSVEERAVLPVLDPARAGQLEYDITRALAGLAGLPRPRVTLLTGLPWLMGRAGGLLPDGTEAPSLPPPQVMADLADLTDLTVLPATFDQLPPDPGLLLIIQPPPLSPWQQYLLDQHVIRTGAAVVMLDPASLSAVEGGGGEPVAGDHLGALPSAWGFAVSPDVVIDRGAALRMQTRRNGRTVEAPQPLAFAATRPDPAAPATSGADPAAASLLAALTRPVHVGTPGAVIAAGRAQAVLPLLTGTPDSMRIDARRALAAPAPDELAGVFAATGSREVLAALITRPLVSAFASGPPPVPSRSGEALERLGPIPAPAALVARRDAPARILVIADTDFLADGYYRTGSVEVAANAALVLAAVDALAPQPGVVSLAALRTRSARDRPLAVVEAIRQRAAASLLDEDQRLRTRITLAEDRLAALESEGAGSSSSGPEAGTGGTSARSAGLAAVRTELLAARQRLRQVQDAARRDIDAIRAALVWTTAGLVPLLILAAGSLVARRARRPA